jgi:hypothetical protein
MLSGCDHETCMSRLYETEVELGYNLKVETVGSSETLLVAYLATRCHNPQDYSLKMVDINLTRSCWRVTNPSEYRYSHFTM